MMMIMTMTIGVPESQGTLLPVYPVVLILFHAEVMTFVSMPLFSSDRPMDSRK